MLWCCVVLSWWFVDCGRCQKVEEKEKVSKKQEEEEE